MSQEPLYNLLLRNKKPSEKTLLTLSSKIYNESAHKTNFKINKEKQ